MHGKGIIPTGKTPALHEKSSFSRYLQPQKEDFVCHELCKLRQREILL